MSGSVQGLDAHDSAGVASNAGSLKADGYLFAAQYIDQNASTADGGAGITPAQARTDSGAGLALVSIYETNGMSSSVFSTGKETYAWQSYLTYQQGMTDAAEAVQSAQTVGQPGGSAIYFAMDFDPADTTGGFTEQDALNAVVAYFQGVANYLASHGSPYQVGVYGAGDTLQAVSKAGLAQYTWLSQSSGWAGYADQGGNGNAATHGWTMIQSNQTTASTVAIDPDQTAGASYGAYEVACYAAGTHILTARGEIAIESLRVGDRVMTLSGRGANLKPVRWLGRRGIAIAGDERAWAVRPVRILAGAFDVDAPHRDLVVSPGHCLAIDGRLIEAVTLVNGATILREGPPAIDYWHLEVEGHDIVVAEGLAAESYQDVGNRGAFAAGSRIDEDLPLDAGGAEGCLPRGDLDATLRARLIARAEALGFARTTDPAPWIELAGLRIWPRREGAAYRFVLPAPCHEARLRSRVTRPCDVDPATEDSRVLGLSLRRLVLLAGETRHEIGLDDERLTQGFWLVERGADGRPWRWTDGDAALALAALTGGVAIDAVEIEIDEGLGYWVAETAAASADRTPDGSGLPVTRAGPCEAEVFA